MNGKIFSTIKKLAQATSKTLKTDSQKRAPEHKIIRWREEKRTLFGAKPYLTRKDLRRTLEKLPDNIPGIGKFKKEERLGLADYLFPEKEVGTYITPYEYHRGIRRLKKDLHRSPSLRERQEIRKKIKFLEYLKGEKDEK